MEVPWALSSDSEKRTWCEIDLGAVERNARRIMDRSPGRRLIGVVKADAYGHGAVPITRVLERVGASMIGVGDSTEAMELLRAGIDIPLLILGDIVAGETEAVVTHGVRATVHSRDRIEILAAAAARLGRVHSVHLKVDTGLGRLGMMPEMAVEAAKAVARSKHLRLEGLCTHMSDCRVDHHEMTNRQLVTFRQVLEGVSAAVGRPPYVHALSSAGAWNAAVVDGVTDAMRIGGGLYGVPGPTRAPHPFEVVMTLKSKIIFLKDVPAGTAVGYNGRFVTGRATRLATIPIGYADGFPSGGTGRSVMISGRRAPIVGAVSMDYTTLDVTDVPGCAVGEDVLLFGRRGQDYVPLESVAQSVGISNYAVTCGIGKRIRRLYSAAHPAVTAS